MKEQDLIYLAGLVDGAGSIEVNVSPHSNYATGFRFEPKIRLSLDESDAAVLGLLDEYCEEQGIQYSIEEREGSDTLRFVVQDPAHLCVFIDGFGNYLIRRYEDARIMLNEILPKVKDGEHRSKQGIYELMEYVEELREGTGRDPKYTQEWFENEWGDEIKT